MDVIKEWVTNIILFILIATIIDMLLPNSALRKYTKMVTGLLLIAVILTPVFNIFSNDFEKTLASISKIDLNKGNGMENLIEMKKKEIQASQHAYIVEQMAVQLKMDVEEELIKQYGLEIVKIDFLTDQSKREAFPENIDKLIVLLQEPQEGNRAIEAVKKIDINTKAPLQSQQETNTETSVAKLLAKRWDIDEKIVQVVLEGGIAKEDGQR